MIYKELNFGEDGYIKFHIIDKGKQLPADGDGVEVFVSFEHDNLPYFGERVSFKSPNETKEYIPWYVLLNSNFYSSNNSQKFVFSGPNYHVAIEKSKEWIDYIAKTIETAIVNRQMAHMHIGFPPN